jgi:rhomboid protease GluP
MVFMDDEQQQLIESLPSPEDFLPSPKKQRGPLSEKPTVESARPALTAFIFFFIASYFYWQDLGDSRLWVSGKSIFVDHEYWRLFTALFTHADLGHLLANTPLFLIFGWFLHYFFGWLVFPITAFLIGIGSNLITIYFYNPQTHLIGASGMLYGMVSLWLVLYIRFETDYTVWMRFFRALAFSLAVLFPTTFQPTTSYLAHAAGFFLGLLAGCLLIPFVKVRDKRDFAR